MIGIGNLQEFESKRPMQLSSQEEEANQEFLRPNGGIRESEEQTISNARLTQQTSGYVPEVLPQDSIDEVPINDAYNSPPNLSSKVSS